jgi:hypothetical protein
MEIYLVEWECISCGQKHSFRQILQGPDAWPNKFELTCENREYGQSQDVPLRACLVTPIEEDRV